MDALVDAGYSRVVDEDVEPVPALHDRRDDVVALMLVADVDHMHRRGTALLGDDAGRDREFVRTPGNQGDIRTSRGVSPRQHPTDSPTGPGDDDDATGEIGMHGRYPSSSMVAMGVPAGKTSVMPALRYPESVTIVMPLTTLAAALHRNTSGYACSSGVAASTPTIAR